MVDSVESANDSIKNKRCGSFDPMEVFSCHASKYLNGFEGGYITTNSKTEYYALIKLMEVHNLFDLSMNKTHAVIAYSNLQEIKLFHDHNYQVYHEYFKNIDKLDTRSIRLLEFGSDKVSSGFKNVVVELKIDASNVEKIKSLFPAI